MSSEFINEIHHHHHYHYYHCTSTWQESVYQQDWSVYDDEPLHWSSSSYDDNPLDGSPYDNNQNNNPPLIQNTTAAAALFTASTTTATTRGNDYTNVQLALLCSAASTLLYHQDLALLLLHALARPLHVVIHRPRLVPAALRPLRHGPRPSSSYWPALHALWWELHHNQEALGWFGCSFIFIWLTSSVGIIPQGLAQALVGGAVPLLTDAAQLYAHLLLTLLGVTWAVGAVWFAGEVMSFAVWVAVQTAKELAVQWTGLAVRHWMLGFTGLMGWVIWGVLSELEYKMVQAEVAHWFLLTSAESVYLLGDVVRDIAKSIDFEFM
ncbi:hypothetical protein C7999DRAFT_28071 [Corynascus novoguineensis]|uniref:Uncharacterized protein n=1 Tax=Corynascus novoguineensis TaxID=1126955 RepID=A0AAN7HIJ5_9PEZI|nr:hypothetical protein C7999DRAFT_28071 [Corynascus novoguineensis]